MAYLSGVIEKMLERLGSVELGGDFEVPELGKKLGKVRLVLDDAEDKQFADEDVKKWVEDLDKVVFKADDFVEELINKARSKKQFRVNSIHHSLINLTFKKQALTGRRDEILKDLVILLHKADVLDLKVLKRGGDSRVRERKRFGRRLVLGWQDERDVCGRDGDKEEILKNLLSDGDDVWGNVGVVSIVGMAGIGKTTLARLVYEDRRVEYNGFDVRAWVTLSTESDIVMIMKSLLVHINATNYPTTTREEPELRLKVKEALIGQKFLFVINDVGDEYVDDENWDLLMSSFTTGSRGSRIIITTRNRGAARGIVHEVGVLDENSCWSLFVSRAFEGGKEPANEPEIADIGKKIVKTCGGVPLLIGVIGCLLRAENLDITTWRSFYETGLSDVLKSEDSIVSSLRLGYNSLPRLLKHCFTYCLLFPRDYEFDVQMLVQVWVSHQFIPSRRDTCPEDLGYKWFLGMADRFFFQVTERDEWGNVTKCKLQSSFYDFATSIVRKNAFATLHLNREIATSSDPRHASFDFHLDSAWQIPTALPKAKWLRSLVLNRQSRWDVEGSSGDVVCGVATKFKSLRMLDLHNSGIKIVPSSIAKLKHLRYLDLSRNVNLKELPKSITSLWNLQTLKLNSCSNLRALPRDIHKLINLRNLENESCYSLAHMPRGLGQLSNLRTVSEFVLPKSTTSKRSDNLKELNNLNVLSGRLKIKNLRCPDHDGTKDALLKDKKHLRSLVLIWDIEASTNHEKSLEDLKPHQNLRELCLSLYGGEQLSSWLPSLVSLVKLQLSKCPKCQWLPRLDKLPRLRVLVVDELTDLSFISKEVTRGASTQLFPELDELRLANLPNLEKWWKDAEDENRAFCRLSKLTVENCPLLTSMPLFPTLEEITLTNTKLAPLQRTINWSLATSSSSTSVSKLKTLRMANMSRCDPSMFQSLPSLQSLTLDHLLDIDSDFLKKLGYVTTLRDLHIWRCDSLEQVSGWIGEIKSLKTLSLRLCPNLVIPSEQISLITCLSRVEIDNCPLASHVESMIRDRLYMKKPDRPSKTNKGKESM